MGLPCSKKLWSEPLGFSYQGGVSHSSSRRSLPTRSELPLWSPWKAGGGAARGDHSYQLTTWLQQGEGTAAAALSSAPLQPSSLQLPQSTAAAICPRLQGA